MSMFGRVLRATRRNGKESVNRLKVNVTEDVPSSYEDAVRSNREDRESWLMAKRPEKQSLQ